MTVQPISIEAGENLAAAVEVMAKHQIRHLPVMQDSEVVGILSDRDIKLAQSIEGINIDQLPVLDICVEEPYIVGPDEPLSHIASTMASKHYGSAIIVQNDKLVGIFTTVDACRALSEILQTRFH